MSKFTYAERELIKSIVASLSIKRIPEYEIISEIQRQTDKTISHSYLGRIKKSIKKESFKWFNTMRQGRYEYIHEFRERMNEIIDLQKWHQNVIANPNEPTSIKQVSATELHRLNLSLANYLDVLPSIIGSQNNATLSTPLKELSTEQPSKQTTIIV